MGCLVIFHSADRRVRVARTVSHPSTQASEPEMTGKLYPKSQPWRETFTGWSAGKRRSSLSRVSMGDTENVFFLLPDALAETKSDQRLDRLYYGRGKAQVAKLFSPPVGHYSWNNLLLTRVPPPSPPENPQHLLSLRRPDPVQFGLQISARRLVH